MNNTQCGVGSYFDLIAKSCKNCYFGCDSCTAFGPNNCTSCSYGYYLLNDVCFSTCPLTTMPNDYNRTCTPCDIDSYCTPCMGSNKMVYRNRCFATCPSNTASYDNVTCFDCYDTKCRFLILPNLYIVSALTGAQLKSTDYPPDDSKTVAYVISILLVVLILTVVCVAIAITIFMKRRNSKAKQIVRL